MGAVGFGFILLGYSVLWYGIGLATQQHVNFMYGSFHVGPKGSGQTQTVTGQTTTLTASTSQSSTQSSAGGAGQSISGTGGKYMSI